MYWLNLQNQGEMTMQILMNMFGMATLRKQYILKVIKSPGICRGGYILYNIPPVYENRVSFTGSSLSPVI